MNLSNFTYVASHQSTKFTMLAFDLGKIHFGGDFTIKCGMIFYFMKNLPSKVGVKKEENREMEEEIKMNFFSINFVTCLIMRYMGSNDFSILWER